MSEDNGPQNNETKDNGITRRTFVGSSSAALAALSGLPKAYAQEQTTTKPLLESQEKAPRSADHHLPNETIQGPRNAALEDQNPDINWPPETDNGTVPPFKYPFAFARKRLETGGWTRQVTVRELPVSKSIAGVEMRLMTGGVRELHWHVSSEWAIMLYGKARITAVDQHGRSHVSDVSKNDLWLFPPGIPHSIQGLGPDGAQFLLVFDDGNFDEFQTFLLTDWMAHTPKEVLAKNFGVPESTFSKLPRKELFIFPTGLPGDLATEQQEAAAGTGTVEKRYDFSLDKMPPSKVTAGGEVKIVDSRNFPVTGISSAIVRLKPGGLRELHWHPNADEWQYFISGKARMTLFAAGTRARTMNFQEGDVGYVLQSQPHYIENIGDTDLVFLEMFKSPHYEEISLNQWLAHTPHQLVNQHLNLGKAVIDAIPKDPIVVTPK